MIPGNANPLLLASAAAADAAVGPTKSLRFNSGDSTYLSRSQSSGNSRTFTYAFWLKAPVSGTWPCIIGADSSSNERAHFRWNGTQLQCYFISGGSQILNLQPNRVFRDKSAWYHIVLAFDTTQSTASDRAKLYINGTQESSFAYSTYPSQNATVPINNSSSTAVVGRRNYDGSNYFNGYLADIYFIDGSALDPTSFGAFDSSGVWQAATYSGTFGTNGFHLLDFANESTIGHDSSGNENDFTANNLRSADVSGGAPTVTGTGPNFPAENTAIANLWDGSVSSYPDDFLTAADGGVITISWPSAIQGVTSIEYYSFNGNDRHNVNEGGWSGSGSGSGYKTAYSGSAIGLTKLQLQKNDQASFVKIGAIKINGTILTTSNYQSDSDTTDIYFDVPTNGTQSDTGVGGEVSGNYCTWNPLVGRYNDSGQSGTAPTFSNGNLNVSGGQTNDRIAGTFNFNVGQSGKYYWEVTFTGTPASSNGAGVRDYSAGTSTQVLKFWYYDGSTVDGGPATSFTTGDVLGFALDLSAGTIDCYKNGGSSVGQMDISSLTSVTPFVSTNSGVGVVGNFGQRAFAYSAPSGYKALCTTNLPTPTIADGSAHFDTTLWTGDGNTGRNITGFSFSPDWAWVKSRSAAKAHALFDTVRGANKRLQSSSTNAETTHTDQLSAFISNGFTVEDNNTVNDNGATYVGWSWNAGANSNKTYTVTVVSDSGNKYRFDGHGTSAVTLDLAEGSTYIFDQSDSSNAGHPLRFSTTSDGTHGGGSEYTTGVTTTGTPGSAGAKTTIVVGSGVATLYYYCTNHSGMGGQANTNSTAGSTRLSGSLTANFYDQSVVWSNLLASTGTVINATRGFNGVLSNVAQAESGSYTLTIDLSNRGFTGDVEWYNANGNVQGASLNGGTDPTGSGTSAAGWYTLGTLASGDSCAITFNGNGSTPYCAALRIGGKILVDSGVSLSGLTQYPSINSVVKANSEAGFSIVSYTGNGTADATVGHELNATPEMIIVKDRTQTQVWNIYHASKDTDGDLLFDTSTGTVSDKITATSSSTFTVADDGNVNRNNDNYIAYCFTPVANYSQFGKYVGNGSSGDGPFIALSFRPRWVLIKATSITGQSWYILDAARDPHNLTANKLEVNSSNAENASPNTATTNSLDLLSNGFKLRTNNDGTNQSGATYIYAAFSENAFSLNGGLAR